MRRKSDGTAFEREFQAEAEKLYYTKRLHTPSAQYPGLGQPSDYYVVQDKFNYVELKETADKAFSITAMQQYDKMIDFVNDKERYPLAKMEYWIIVHFIAYNKLVAITASNALKLSASHKRLTAAPQPNTISATTLLELLPQLDF